MGSQREITHGPDRGRVRIRRPAGPAPSHHVNGCDPALAAQRRETIVTWDAPKPCNGWCPSGARSREGNSVPPPRRSTLRSSAVRPR